MFGYVTISPEGLAQERRERYRSFYCGLCGSLRDRYGVWGRITLSYDMTFLSILLCSLYEPPEIGGEERCLPHPFKKHRYTRSEICDYCADMNIALAYHKCLDDVNDERKPSARLEEAALRGAYARVREKYPDKCELIERRLGDISAIEKSGASNVDEPANATGDMLGAVYRLREDEWADTLERVGQGLGRFIYLMDAYDDLPRDIRKGCYNPLRELGTREDYDALVKRGLTLLIAEATEAFEELPLVQDMDILRNILYAGCWLRYSQLQMKRDKARGKPEPKEDGHERPL